MPPGRDVNASTNFGGIALLKIWEGKKRSKIGAIEFERKYLWNRWR